MARWFCVSIYKVYYIIVRVNANNFGFVFWNVLQLIQRLTSTQEIVRNKLNLLLIAAFKILTRSIKFEFSN